MGAPFFIFCTNQKDGILIFYIGAQTSRCSSLYLVHLNTGTLDKKILLSQKTNNKKTKNIRLGHCTWQGGGSTHIRLFTAIRLPQFIVVEGHKFAYFAASSRHSYLWLKVTTFEHYNNRVSYSDRSSRRIHSCLS